MERLFKFLLGFLILSSILITLYFFIFFAYTSVSDKETIIYKGPATVVDTFHYPEKVYHSRWGSVTQPERNGVILKTNILKREFDLTFHETMRYKNLLKRDEKVEMDIIITLHKSVAINNLEPEITMFFKPYKSSYVVGDKYKE